MAFESRILTVTIEMMNQWCFELKSFPYKAQFVIKKEVLFGWKEVKRNNSSKFLIFARVFLTGLAKIFIYFLINFLMAESSNQYKDRKYRKFNSLRFWSLCSVRIFNLSKVTAKKEFWKSFSHGPAKNLPQTWQMCIFSSAWPSICWSSLFLRKNWNNKIEK